MGDEIDEADNETLLDNPHAEVDCECVYCGQDYDFEVPRALIQALREKRLVIFAGAGISTETSRVFPSTFYDEIKADLPDDLIVDDFPAVMSAYEEAHGRLQLVQQVIKRLRSAETFPAVRQPATRFHEELASLTQVREVITTNWDPFFEQVCGAMPIVVDGDYAFYNLPDRKVYKIHGSLSNVSTLVATTDDYEETEKTLRMSAVGGTLRHLLATKVVVFTGYSLRDADFRNVYEPLMDGMGKLRPISYFVGPYESTEAQTLGLRHIKTDGAHFLRVLKAELVKSGDLLPDEVLQRAFILEDVARDAHTKTAEMDWKGRPELVFSLAYQDGLIDILSRIRSQWRTGEYTDPNAVHGKFHSYSHLLQVALERERYWDAAYINGYRMGLMLLLLDDEDLDLIALYELFDDPIYGQAIDESGFDDMESDEPEEVDAENEGDEPSGHADVEDDDGPWSLIISEDELVDLLDGVFEYFPAAGEEARRIAARMGPDMVPDHTPFLSGVMDPK